MPWRSFCCVLVLGAALGCESGTTVGPTTKVTPPQPNEVAKLALEGIATSGEIGSGIMDIENNLMQMKAKEPEKAEMLLEELKTLRAAKSPDEVKKKAAEMAAKL